MKGVATPQKPTSKAATASKFSVTGKKIAQTTFGSTKTSARWRNQGEAIDSYTDAPFQNEFIN